jgi:hypothetical protein
VITSCSRSPPPSTPPAANLPSPPPPTDTDGAPPPTHIAVVAVTTIVMAPAAAVQLTARILQGLRDQPIEGGAVEGPWRRRRSVVDTDEDVVSVVGNAPSASNTTSLGLAFVIHGARISWKKIRILHTRAR